MKEGRGGGGNLQAFLSFIHLPPVTCTFVPFHPRVLTEYIFMFENIYDHSSILHNINMYVN